MPTFLAVLSSDLLIHRFEHYGFEIRKQQPKYLLVTPNKSCSEIGETIPE